MRFNLDNLKNIEFKRTENKRVLEKMRALYPHATEEQLQDGVEALTEYLKVAIRIINRLARENPDALTMPDKISTIQTQRSNPTNNEQPFNNL